LRKTKPSIEEAMRTWLEENQDMVWNKSNTSKLEWDWDHKIKQSKKLELASSLVIGESVLDFGCGTGDLYRYLRNNGYEGSYYGIDQSIEMLVRAKKRNPDGKFVAGNLYDPIDLPRFDTVVSLDVLHHQPEIEPGFSRLYSLAKMCLIVTLWINDRDANHSKQTKGRMGEIITWYNEDELRERFSGLRYEVYEAVGCPWKDMYRFLKNGELTYGLTMDGPKHSM
jgi:SAM-dependent methyltransferase